MKPVNPKPLDTFIEPLSIPLKEPKKPPNKNPKASSYPKSLERAKAFGLGGGFVEALPWPALGFQGFVCVEGSSGFAGLWSQV